MTPPDHELLENFRLRGSEPAFTELLNRHLGLVFSAALRITRQPSLAEEISQNVFVKLARLQSPLKSGLSLVVWLHQTTRSTAIDLMRAETRRRKREETAASLVAVSDTNAPWSDIAPVLDEVIGRLSPDDRHLLLSRYLEGQSYTKLSRALGLSEDATRMRVNRALEKVRSLLQKRGVTCTATALALALPAHAITAVPSGLSATISASALAAAAAPLSLTTIGIITMTKQTVAIAAAFLVLAVVGVSVFLATRPDPTPESTPALAGTGSAKSSARTDDPSSLGSRAHLDPSNSASEFDELTQKYGAAEVKVARQIAVEFALVSDEMKAVIEAVEVQKRKQAGLHINKIFLGRAEELKLTSSQEAKMKELYDHYYEMIFAQFDDCSKGIRKDPRKMMEFFLASNARTQGSMSEEEFQSLAKFDNPVEDSMLRMVFAPVPIEDNDSDLLLTEDFQRAFRPTLSADQLPVFDEIVSAKVSAHEASIKPFPAKKLSENQQAVKDMGEVISQMNEVLLDSNRKR